MILITACPFDLNHRSFSIYVVITIRPVALGKVTVRELPCRPLSQRHKTGIRMFHGRANLKLL